MLPALTGGLCMLFFFFTVPTKQKFTDKRLTYVRHLIVFPSLAKGNSFTLQ